MLSQLSTAMQTRTEASSLLFTPWDATYTRASKAWKSTEEWGKQACYVGQLSCRVAQIAIAVLACLGFLVSLLPAALGTGLNLFYSPAKYGKPPISSMPNSMTRSFHEQTEYRCKTEEFIQKMKKEDLETGAPDQLPLNTEVIGFSFDVYSQPNQIEEILRKISEQYEFSIEYGWMAYNVIEDFKEHSKVLYCVIPIQCRVDQSLKLIEETWQNGEDVLYDYQKTQKIPLDQYEESKSHTFKHICFSRDRWEELQADLCNFLLRDGTDKYVIHYLMVQKMPNHQEQQLYQLSIHATQKQDSPVSSEIEFAQGKSYLSEQQQYVGVDSNIENL